MQGSHRATDLSLSRIVDRSEGTDDWRELDRAAGTGDDVWRELADLLREDRLFRVGGEELERRSASVSLPPSRAGLRWSRVAKPLLGAAALVLAWLLGRGPEPLPATGGENRESLGELVPVVVERRALAGGEQFELILLRQTLEREVVPALYEVGVNEHEELVPHRVEETGSSEVSYL